MGLVCYGRRSLGVCVCATAGSESAWGTMDEVFAFERTVSRLMEMRSEEYLSKAWTPDVEMDPSEGLAALPGSDSDA